MRAFVNKHRYSLTLFLLFVVSGVLVNPLGEFPLNDDWAYSKSVSILISKGHIYIGDFGSMTLVAHVLWGALFAKSFGFSFFILRFSTLVSAFIGIYVLYKLVHRISSSRRAGFFAALTLMFNPLHFNLSFTYMTDVNYNTWLLLSIYFAHRFFTQKKTQDFILVFVMSLVLVFTRQYGLAFPFCFTLACLFCGEKRWRYSGLALLCSVVILALFRLFDAYLLTELPPYAGYNQHARIKPDLPELAQTFKANFLARYIIILAIVFVYCAGFCLGFLASIFKAGNKKILALMFVLSVIVFIPLFWEAGFLYGNIFSNLSLGPETTYDSLVHKPKPEDAYTYSPAFAGIVNSIGVLLTLISGFVISVLAFDYFKSSKNQLLRNPVNSFTVLLLAYSIAYILLLCITKSFFDRYLIPLITIGVLALAGFTGHINYNKWLALPLLALLAYVSIAGTRDYFTINRIKWKAVDLLKQEKHAGVDKINGGFEVNCWNNGEITWWTDFLNPEPFDYMISYREIPGFVLYKEFEFNRSLPFKKDKINIFARDSLKKND